MQVIIRNTPKELAQVAYQMVKCAIMENGYKVLGLTAGNSPLGLYAELVRGCRKKEIDFSDISAFNVNEYLGMDADTPQSHRLFMEANLFAHINIKPSNIHFLDGLTSDVEDECDFYETQITSLGGIKLQVLGLGRDGHIGFNEPGSSLESRTHYVTLTEETRQDNKRFFPPNTPVPKWALTMGIGTIMDASDILLIATGSEKAAAVRDMLEGPVSQFCPASILQTHPHATILLDDPAASKLTRRDFWEKCDDDFEEMMAFLAQARRKAGLE